MSIDPQDIDSRDTAPQDAAETETQVLPQAPESSETPTVVAPPADEVVTESDETEVVQTVVIETESLSVKSSGRLW